MRPLAIAWKDVRHVYRSWSGLAMMLLAPLLLAGAIGAAFGSGDNFSISPVKTMVVNQDAAAAGARRRGRGRRRTAGAALTAALTSPQLAKLLDRDPGGHPGGRENAPWTTATPRWR